MNQNQRKEIESSGFISHDEIPLMMCGEVLGNRHNRLENLVEHLNEHHWTFLFVKRYCCDPILKEKTISCSLFLLWSDPTIASCNISEMQSMLLYLLQYCHTCRANMTRVVFLQFLKINILYIDGSTDLSTYLIILNKIVSFGVFAELIWRQGGGWNNTTKVVEPVLRGF